MSLVQFYPLDVTMRVINKRLAVTLHGRTPSGERVSVIDQNFVPYFYLLPKDQDIESLQQEVTHFSIRSGDVIHAITRTERVVMKLSEKETLLIKAYVTNPFSIQPLAEALSSHESVKGVFEHDIPLMQNYLLDRRVVPCVLTSVEGDIINSHARIPVVRAQTISQGDDDVVQDPVILGFDIETYIPEKRAPSPEHDPVIMISFYGPDFKKTITWKKFHTDNKDIEFVDGEYDLLMRFKKVIEEVQPDFLVGYGSDLLQFPYIKKRSDKYGIALDLGMDRSIASIGKSETSINGIVHIDLYKFIERMLRSKLETDGFRLQDVAQEILGEGKKDVDLEKFTSIWDSEPSKLEPYCEYNQHDAYLICKLAHSLLPLLYEYIKLTNLLPFESSRASISQFVEAFLIKESKFWNELIPPKPRANDYVERTAHSYTGGFVVEPEPGLYNNIVVYDFTALYPSIIATHNISKGTLNCRCCSELVPGETIHFCKKITGFFPRVLTTLIDRRRRIAKMLSSTLSQKQLLGARQEALKSIANATYGHFGYPSSRWYDIDCAKSITAYGRKYINDVISSTKEEGFDILYADTDSVFIKAGTKKEAIDTFFEKLNSSLPEKMHLSFEGFYPRGIFIASKTGKGAKKKYALVTQQGSLKIQGFESSRRNYSIIAKETQEKVLHHLLKERSVKKAVDDVREAVENITEHKSPLRKMIIYTQLQKDVSKYETIAPHVAVAQKMQKEGFTVVPGLIIKYIVTPGDGSIAERSQLLSEATEYDSSYYVEHQVLASVDKIFEAIGVDIRKALDEKEQSSLAEFI